MKLLKEYLYKLDEFYSQDQGGHWKHDGDEENFTTLIQNYGLGLASISYHGYGSTYASTCNALWEMLKVRHRGDYCYLVKYLPLDVEQPLSESQCIDLLQGFINIFNLTLPRYLPLLKAYQDNDTSPLAQMESTSDGKTRFNDTPQGDDLADGYYSDDSHDTNVTAAVTTTKTDPAALYEQLDHLFRNWRSILKDWLLEFDGLFIEGVDLL